jgi:hypothetical protein
MYKSTLLLTISLFIITKTAFADCVTHTYTTCADGIVHYYDPNTGEVCDPIDCGGVQGPIKTDVPGCPQYSGTAVLTTSYLSCWTPSASTTKPSLSTTITKLASQSLGSGSSSPPTVTSSATLTKSQLSGNGTLSTSTKSPPGQTTNAANSAGRPLVGIVAAASGGIALL